jgi:hypothetical protein
MVTRWISDAYLAYVDQLVGAYLDAGFDIGLVANHGMNDKARPDGSPNAPYCSSPSPTALPTTPSTSPR